MKARTYTIIREVDSHFLELKKEIVYQSRRRKYAERFLSQLGKLHSSRGEEVIFTDSGLTLPNYSSTYYIVRT